MGDAQVLYRFYSDNGQLLYVGITINPPQRFLDHQTQSWWHRVCTITMEIYCDRTKVRRAERRAIEIEKPLWNKAHNTLATEDRYESTKSQADGQCPHCGRNVIFSRSHNLIFHIDGSDNIECWVHIRQGAVHYTGRTDR